MLYPTVSDYWNSRTQSRAVATYSETVASMSEQDYDEMFAEAEAYNRKLAQVNMPFVNYDQVEDYEDILDISGTGIMGYVTMRKSEWSFPFITGRRILSFRLLQGISGIQFSRRGKRDPQCDLGSQGTSSAKLFTELDEIEEGDTFTVTVLNRRMTYQVDQIRIVELRRLRILRSIRKRITVH